MDDEREYIMIVLYLCVKYMSLHCHTLFELDTTVGVTAFQLYFLVCFGFFGTCLHKTGKSILSIFFKDTNVICSVQNQFHDT